LFGITITFVLPVVIVVEASVKPLITAVVI